VGLDEALLTGQAPDRGLYLPERVPALGRSEIAELRDRSYPEIAHAVLGRFTAGVIEEAALEALCHDAYDFDVPLERVTRRLWLMRLDRGPTASFKDFAARVMARLMGHLMRGQAGELLILTATSGDTGSAVAHAYSGVERVRVVVLFPIDEVSARQRKQMTTIGGNVTTIAVDGKFDDCQAMVKQAFADPALRHLRQTSANSINIGRLLPQAVYYVYAYVKLTAAGADERLTICVPSGNFGNMMGAMLAWRMGVPIERLVIATNSNDEVPKFLATGDYHTLAPSRVCISNAMNVGHPSNLARLVDFYGGWLDEAGRLRKAPALDAMRRDLYAVSISDEQTRQTIRSAYAEHRTILEPHGAVGWAGLTRYLGELPAGIDPLCVSVETAHPAKFPEEIEAAIGVTPEVPPSLAGLELRTEHYESLAAEYEPFRELLQKRYG